MLRHERSRRKRRPPIRGLPGSQTVSSHQTNKNFNLILFFRATSSLATLEHKAKAFDILVRHLPLNETTVSEWEDQFGQVPEGAYEFGELINALCMWTSMGLAQACFQVTAIFHRIDKLIGYFYLQVSYRLCRFDRINSFIGYLHLQVVYRIPKVINC